MLSRPVATCGGSTEGMRVIAQYAVFSGVRGLVGLGFRTYLYSSFCYTLGPHRFW